jgi:ABC-type transporter Mla subunit MlaD
VEGLAMIPGLYTYAATAIVAGALAFGAGLQTQAWRYEAQIADIHAQHAAAIASANQKALDDTIKMQRTKDDAIKAAEQRAKTQAANAAVLRTERDGLRAQLAATTVQLPSASCASVRDYATTITGLFDQCAGAFEGMAGKAQGHAADARLMLESWPK